MILTKHKITVSQIKSIHEVAEELWDSLLPPINLLHTHRFLQAVENARVEVADHWYLLFWEDEKLLATAALSSFEINLDLFLDATALKLVHFIRKAFPNFLKVKILLCGLPVSLGQSNIVIADQIKNKEVLSLLVEKMDSISKNLNIKQLCVKEFKESEIGIMDELILHKFFRAYSIPYVNMEIRWGSFNEYLSDLRHPYRRKIKKSLAKIGMASPQISSFNEKTFESKTPKLVLGGGEVCPPADFFSLYLKVMERAETKLETLNESFFHNFYRQVQPEMKILALINKGEVLSAAVLTKQEGVLSFLLVGRSAGKDEEFDSYYNLIYGIIAVAIQNKCSLLKLGQTAYHVKQRIGGKPTHEFIYYKAKNPLLHFSLNKLKHILFPEIKLPAMRIFRSS